MFKRSIIFLLLSILPAFAANAAIVTAIGVVTVNNSSVRSSSTVMPGDHLETAAASVAVANGAGYSIQLGPESQANLVEGGLALLRGDAVVSGKTKIIAGAATVTSNADNPKYSVQRLVGKTIVAVREGSVEVLFLGKSIPVIAGTTRSFSDDGRSKAMVHGLPHKNALVFGTGSASAAGWILLRSKPASSKCPGRGCR